MYKIILFLLLSMPSSIVGQKVNGNVFDADSQIQGAKVFNKTQNILVYTDQEGHFSIPANIHDVLEFTSYFHLSQLYAVKEIDFKRILVIELKKVLNELDEVELKEQPKEKHFDSTIVNSEIHRQIKNDIKNNPSLYGHVNTAGLDFVAIGKLIGGLFKRNNKNENSFSPITYYQLDSLFTKSPLFTEKLLYENLKIPAGNKYLFMEYCSVKKYSTHLLREEKQLVLLDSLYNASKEFLKLLQKEIKD